MEDHNNGCMVVVDVFDPIAPVFLLLIPALMKATLVPVLVDAASPIWTFSYAPHDLGRYPHATGPVDGGETSDDDQMPVEESANMLLLHDGSGDDRGRPRVVSKILHERAPTPGPAPCIWAAFGRIGPVERTLPG